ncbi:MAG: type II toxin-antitoxin system CcdA family antitoxin [Hyphomonadaceae bacterium]|jgi:antitoxin CcdA|nr:type II toxin-antitoxin system CcdA family antitoxin [Hyphomonadaceae bacterium]
MTHTVTTPKKRLNLTVSEHLIDAAKAAGLNMSEIAEVAIGRALAEEERKAWERDHADGIASYNRRIANTGMWSDGYRSF